MGLPSSYESINQLICIRANEVSDSATIESSLRVVFSGYNIFFGGGGETHFDA